RGGIARPTGARSPALELRAALFREGLDALLIVLAVEAVGDELLEHGQIALAVGTHELLDGSLGRAQGERSVARHRQRVGAREGLELRLRHDLGHQAHAKRVLGAEVRARGEEDLLRVGGEIFVAARTDFSAPDALRMGLVNQVVRKAELVTFTRTY